jgi:chemotaxis signal transduction protein
MDTDAGVPVKTRGLLAFRIGDVDFGARVEDVAGLVEADRLAPLPGSREPVAGLVAFRGGIVIAIDLSAFLGERPTSGPYRFALVLARGGDRLALVIPSLPRLVPGSALSGPERHESTDADTNALVDSVYDHEGSRIHCLHYWAALEGTRGRGAAA